MNGINHRIMPAHWRDSTQSQPNLSTCPHPDKTLYPQTRSTDTDLQNIILPYQTIDANLVFHNTNGHGCGMYLSLDGTKNIALSTLLMDMLRMLPPCIDCTIMLHKHHHLQSILQQATYPTSFNLKRHLPLHDYQCYVFLSTRGPRHFLLNYRNRLEKILKLAKYPYVHVGKTNFLVLMRSWLAYPPYAHPWPTVVDTANRHLHELIFPPQTTLRTRESRVIVQHQDALQQPQSWHVINCQIKHHNPMMLRSNPESMLCWPELLLPCPFWFSLTLRKMGKNELFASFHNLALFTNEAQEKAHLKEVTQYFKAWGFQLKPVRSEQDLCFLAGLPFLMTDGLDSEIRIKKLRQPLTIDYLQSLIPIMSDKKSASRGLLLPTETGQIAFFNLFEQASLEGKHQQNTIPKPPLIHPKGTFCAFSKVSENENILWEKQPISTLNFRYMLISQSAEKAVKFQSALIQSGLNLEEKIYILSHNKIFSQLVEKLDGTQIDGKALCDNQTLLNETSPLYLIDMPCMQPSLYPLCDIIRKLLEHCRLLPHTTKKHLIIDNLGYYLDEKTGCIMLRQLKDLVTNSLPNQTGIGFITSFELSSLKSPWVKIIQEICETNIVLGSACIQNYVNTLPNLFSKANSPCITTFDANQIPGYDKVLIHNNSSYGFHRFINNDFS